MSFCTKTPNSSAIISLIALNGICIDGAIDVNTDSLFENHSPPRQFLSEAMMCSSHCVGTKDVQNVPVQEHEFAEVDVQVPEFASSESAINYKDKSLCSKTVMLEIPRERLPEVDCSLLLDEVLRGTRRIKKNLVSNLRSTIQNVQPIIDSNLMNSECCNSMKSFTEKAATLLAVQSTNTECCSDPSLMHFQEETNISLNFPKQSSSTECAVSSITNQSEGTLILPIDGDSTYSLRVVEESLQMASNSESEDEERAQSNDEGSDHCDERELANDREDGTLIDVMETSLKDFSGEDEKNNCRGGHSGRGIVRGGNKRWNKKNRGGKGNRGRGNFNNVSFVNVKGNSRVDECESKSSAIDNFNVSNEFFKSTHESGNALSNSSNTKEFKTRKEIHEMESKCLIGQGHDHEKKQEFLSKGSSPPLNHCLLFGNDSCKKTQNGENSKLGSYNNGNNKDKSNGNNTNKGGNNNNKGNTNNQNSSNKVGGGGDLKWDMLSRHLKHLCYSIGLLKHNNGPGYTLESLCLKFHYRFLVLFFCQCYFIVTLNWYVNEQIICYKMGASNIQQTGPYRDVCLSYPFVVTTSETRRYLLFYRWVPYSFLLAAACVYILRAGPVKKWENFRLGQLCKDVWVERWKLEFVDYFVNIWFQFQSDPSIRVISCILSVSYETSRWTSINNRVVHFIMTGQAESCHYYKWILCHVFANLVVLAAVYYFNFVLQGTFVTLVPDVMFKLRRDPRYFSDPLSTIFPPFVECQISEFHKVVDRNEFNFGCHLTLMELYEKLFFITWCVLALHWLWSSVMILWLAFGLIPFFGKFSCLVTSHLKYKKSVVTMWKTMKMCSLGEVHALYLVKRWMSCAQFDQLLATLLVEKEKEWLNQKKGFDLCSTGGHQNRCSNYTSLQMERSMVPCIYENAHQISEQLKEDLSAPTFQLLSGNPLVRNRNNLDETYIDRFYSAQSSCETENREGEDWA
ncbi:Innexin [Trinorchestia longiramus]|nr:Innexin [Trinorchestia longiramus]